MSERESIVVAGALAGHAMARALAAEVARVHQRYAREIVGHFQLCPFMKDPETAFGRFCVMLDREPDVGAAAEQVVAAGVRLTHLVYPLVTMEATPFERFGSDLHKEVARRLAAGPVHATFHPQMEGGREAPARLVGLLRRAPDPFVQFVPEGLHEGGTVYADPASFDFKQLIGAHPRDRAETTFERLSGAPLDELEAKQREIRADRDRSYARFLEALAG